MTLFVVLAAFVIGVLTRTGVLATVVVRAIAIGSLVLLGFPTLWIVRHSFAEAVWILAVALAGGMIFRELLDMARRHPGRTLLAVAVVMVGLGGAGVIRSVLDFTVVSLVMLAALLIPALLPGAAILAPIYALLRQIGRSFRQAFGPRQGNQQQGGRR